MSLKLLLIQPNVSHPFWQAQTSLMDRVQRQCPDWSIETALPVAPTSTQAPPIASVVLALSETPPTLMILPLGPEPVYWPLALLAQLSARYPATPILAFGPGVQTPATAALALRRCPELRWVGLGSMESLVPDLLLALAQEAATTEGAVPANGPLAPDQVSHPAALSAHPRFGTSILQGSTTGEEGQTTFRPPGLSATPSPDPTEVDPTTQALVETPMQPSLPVIRPSVPSLAFLELARPALPFSLLPVGAQPLPMERPLADIEASLTTLLRAQVPQLQLLPTPLEVRPGLLTAVLKAVISLRAQGDGLRTELRVHLPALPDDALLDLLRQAGVAVVRLDHPWESTTSHPSSDETQPGAGNPLSLQSTSLHAAPEPTHQLRPDQLRPDQLRPDQLRPDQKSAAPLPRSGLKRLLDTGFRVEVHLPLGRPGDNDLDLHRLMEYYASIPGLKLQVQVLQLFPGHPLRDEHPDGAFPGLRWAENSAREVVCTPRLTPATLENLRLQGGLLQTLLEYHPGTLRQLARTLEQPILPLVETLLHRLRLMRSRAGGVYTGDPAFRTVQAALASLARESLLRLRHPDFLPQLKAMMDFETHCIAPSQPVSPPKALLVEGFTSAELRHCVLAPHPACSVVTLPYDMLQLMSRPCLGPTPLHPQHHLIRQQGRRPPHVSLITDRQKRLLDRVDGMHTLQELYEALEQSPARRHDGLSHDNALQEGFEGLLERGWIYVRSVRKMNAGTLLEPGAEGGNVLAFRSQKRPIITPKSEEEDT